MRDQIINFLAQGFSKADVIKTVGCSEALYDEIIKAEGFIQALADKKTELIEERIEKQYTALEAKTLKRLNDELEFLETPQLCRVLDTVARNKNLYKRGGNHLTNPAAALSITINIPQPAMNQKVILDSNNQVVAIGERVMTPLPLQSVKDLFAKLENKQAVNAIEELRHDLEISEASAT